MLELKDRLLIILLLVSLNIHLNKFIIILCNNNNSSVVFRYTGYNTAEVQFWQNCFNRLITIYFVGVVNTVVLKHYLL